MKRCPDCGIEYKGEDDLFCRECGKPLQAVQEERPEIGERPKGRCPECGGTVFADARRCPHCRNKLVQAVPYEDRPAKTPALSPDTKKILAKISGALFLIGLILFLLSFHVVVDVPLVVAKEHLSFKQTFVTVSDYVDQWNEASLWERIELSKSNIYRTLLRKKLIVLRSDDDFDPETDAPSEPQLAPADYLKIVSDRGYYDHTAEAFVPAPGWLCIVGEVRNDWTKPLRFVRVTATLYDKQGDVVGADSTYTDPSTISPNSKAPFKITVIDTEVVKRVDHYGLTIAGARE